MNLPSIDDYINALHFEGALGQYAHLKPVKKPDGSLTFSSGNFAVVFKMKCKNTGKHFALKVFHRYQEGRKESYQLISESLNNVESPYLVKYNYLEKEIWVNSALAGDAEYPAIIMDWVEGQTLGQVLQTYCSARNQNQLKILAYHFDEMALWLLNQEFAHGDLKSDNILVLNDGSLKLVDYDGLYTPAMEGQTARENGSPHFRHPKRDVKHFGPYIDDFSLLLLTLSLHTLAENPSLISQHGAGDSILFTESELNQPGVGPKWQSLTAHLGNTTIAPRYELLYMACASPAHLRILGLEPIFKSSVAQVIPSLLEELNSFKDNEGLLEVENNHKNQDNIQEVIVSTFAGNCYHNKDGQGIQAGFYEPSGIAIDSSGNLFVADTYNHKIRKITPDGLVSTFAGNGDKGNADGKGILASFFNPTDIAIDSKGNLFVADFENYKIRKITPDGFVSSFAGTGISVHKDGMGTIVRFLKPHSIAIDSSDNLFVATNNTILKITPNGVVNTFDQKDKIFVLIRGIAIDSFGNLFVIHGLNSNTTDEILKFTPDGMVSTLAGYEKNTDGYVKPRGFFEHLGRIAIDSLGNLLVSENFGLFSESDDFVSKSITIRKITPDGLVSTFANNGKIGDKDGKGILTGFNYLNLRAIDPLGNMFVTDDENKIHKITPDGFVSILAGNGNKGDTDGMGIFATFRNLDKIKIDSLGNLFVSDVGEKIRKITSDGMVSTFNDQEFKKIFKLPLDGFCSISFAEFVLDSLGNLFITKKGRGNNKIEKITPDGFVSTFAGNGNEGAEDGIGTLASFNNPNGMAFDSAGNLFVADTNNHKIRKITPDGLVSTFAGNGNAGAEDGIGTLACFRCPFGIAIDFFDNLFVTDTLNHKIRKITPNGFVSTLAGNENGGAEDGIGTLASFKQPRGIVIDSSGNLFVVDSLNRLIRKITFSTMSGDKA